MQQQSNIPGQYRQNDITIGEWLITLLIMAIPIVNLVMLFVWGFGSGTNPNKANWAKASLIWMAVIFGLYIFFFLIVGLALFSSR